MTNKEGLNSLKAEAIKELYEQKAKTTFDTLGVKDLEQYNAIEKLSKATKLEDLPEDTRKLLPDSIKTPKDAKALVDLAKPELDKIDKTKLATQAEKALNHFSLDYNSRTIEKIRKASKQKLNKLAKRCKGN